MLKACPKSIRKPQAPWAATVPAAADPPPFGQPLALPLYHSTGPNCTGEDTGTCNGDIIQQPVVLQDLSVKYDNYSATFIADSAASGQPFLLYAAFTHVHVPQYAGTAFRNATGSIFQDALAEVDNSVGVIMRALRDAGVENNTLVVLTGDNGPW